MTPHLTWIIFHPGAVDKSPGDVTQKSMYFVYYPYYFVVVCAVLYGELYLNS